jgi:hypothetical protein
MQESFIKCISIMKPSHFRNKENQAKVILTDNDKTFLLK